LRELSPSRLGGLGQELLLALVPERADTTMLLEAAAQQPGDGLDSLVALWGDLMARAGRCDEAEQAFEGVARRRPNAVVRRVANIGLANCGVERGRVALAAGDLEQAEARFREVVLIGMPDSTVRLAWTLLGDVRWASGDTVTAVDAYRRAAAGGDDDNPIVQRALEQLRKLEGTNPGP
jgi:tetratricopeptide (TPR) repeat protein